MGAALRIVRPPIILSANHHDRCPLASSPVGRCRTPPKSHAHTLLMHTPILSMSKQPSPMREVPVHVLAPPSSGGGCPSQYKSMPHLRPRACKARARARLKQGTWHVHGCMRARCERSHTWCTRPDHCDRLRRAAPRRRTGCSRGCSPTTARRLSPFACCPNGH